MYKSGQKEEDEEGIDCIMLFEGRRELSLPCTCCGDARFRKQPFAWPEPRSRHLHVGYIVHIVGIDEVKWENPADKVYKWEKYLPLDRCITNRSVAVMYMMYAE